MAFIRTDLARVATGGGNSIYLYRTADTAATVDTADYFVNAVDMLNVGDLLYVLSGIGGTPAYGLMVVLSNSGTAVDVSDAVALGAVDTD